MVRMPTENHPFYEGVGPNGPYRIQLPAIAALPAPQPHIYHLAQQIQNGQNVAGGMLNGINNYAPIPGQNQVAAANEVRGEDHLGPFHQYNLAARVYPPPQVREEPPKENIENLRLFWNQIRTNREEPKEQTDVCMDKGYENETPAEMPSLENDIVVQRADMETHKLRGITTDRNNKASVDKNKTPTEVVAELEEHHEIHCALIQRERKVNVEQIEQESKTLGIIYDYHDRSVKLKF